MLRLLIKEITVEKHLQSKQAVLHIRWQGGACSDVAVDLPPPIAERLRYPEAIVEQVRTLAQQLPDAQIAEQMNRDGRRNTRGKPFTPKMIGWIRWRHRIPAAPLKRAEELTVKQVAERFGVSPSVVYYWIAREVIPARRVHDGAPYWITLDQGEGEGAEGMGAQLQTHRAAQPFLNATARGAVCHHHPGAGRQTCPECGCRSC